MADTEVPERLPRGRHQMSREAVATAQRERLVRALADVMQEKGYARTSVADVLRRARISRETFYELFPSKEACFMHAFEAANARMLAAVAQGAASAGGDEHAVPPRPAARLDAFLREYLEALAADPASARVFLIEVYAAGPDAARRRTELQHRFADAVAAAFGATGEEERFSIDASIAAVYALVTSRLAVGDIDGLRGLHAPLMRYLSSQAFARANS